jgi:hypothetical protein
MRRLAHSLAPVDSISTLDEMLVHSDCAVEDGSTVWVRSVGSLFVYRRGTGLTPDGITVVRSAFGDGLWLRMTGTSDPLWQSQTDWYVDPANPVASDENTGADAAHPVQTIAEVRRRTRSTFAEGNLTPTIHLQSDILSTDSFIDDFQFLHHKALALPVAILTWQGVRTQVDAGTITAAQQPNPATGADRTVTAAGFAWAPNVARGRQVVMTGGAASGAGFWATKDKGTGVARVSSPCLLTNSFYHAVPVATGTFRIDSLTSINCDAIVNVPSGFRLYRDLSFSSMLIGSGCVTAVQFAHCHLSYFTAGATDAPPGVNNCQMTDELFGGGFINLFGGVVMLVTGSAFAELECGQYQISDLEIQGITNGFRLTHGAYVRMFGLIATWDSGQDGLIVNGSRCEGEGETVYGGGNAGHGIRVTAASTFVYSNKPTVNAGLGAGREASVGGTDKLWAAIPYVETSNLSAIVPVA